MVKRDVLEKYPFSERTFFTKINKNKDLYPSQMTNKYRYWCIHEDIVPMVFKMNRRPDIQDLNRVKKWVRLQKWDWFGNIRNLRTNIKGNIEIINYFFDFIKRKYGKNHDIELMYCIEPNPNDSYYHTHFLIKMDINKSEDKELKSSTYNYFQNRYLVRYNPNFEDSGKDYTMKHMGDKLKSFNHLKHTKRKRNNGR